MVRRSTTPPFTERITVFGRAAVGKEAVTNTPPPTKDPFCGDVMVIFVEMGARGLFPARKKAVGFCSIQSATPRSQFSYWGSRAGFAGSLPRGSFFST